MTNETQTSHPDLHLSPICWSRLGTAALLERYARLEFVLPGGPVHGDANVGNIFRRGDVAVLIDLHGFVAGPRETSRSAPDPTLATLPALIDGGDPVVLLPARGAPPLPDYWAELADHVPGLGDDRAFAVRRPS